MSRPRLLAVVCVVTGLAVATAWGQDPSGTGDGWKAETSEDWGAWSRAFATDLRRQERVADAIEEFMLSGRFDPNDRNAWAAAALIASRQADRQTGEAFVPGSRYYVLAEAAVRATIERLGPLTPKQLDEADIDPRITYTIGRLRFADSVLPENAAKRGKLLVIALAMFRRAAAGEAIDGFDPQDVNAWVFRTSVNLAQVLMIDERHKEAVGLLQEAQDAHGRDPGLTPLDRLFAQIARAELARVMDERERAEDLYRAILEEFPESPRARLGMARVMFDQSRLDEALEHYEMAIRGARPTRPGVAPDNPSLLEALLSAADVCLKFSPPRLERSEFFLGQYEAVRREAPEALYFRGLIAMEREEWVLARNTLRRARRLIPGDRAILANLLRTLNSLGEEDSDEARGITEELKELERRHAEEKAVREAQDAKDAAAEDSDATDAPTDTEAPDSPAEPGSGDASETPK